MTIRPQKQWTFHHGSLLRTTSTHNGRLPRTMKTTGRPQQQRASLPQQRHTDSSCCSTFICTATSEARGIRLTFPLSPFASTPAFRTRGNNLIASPREARKSTARVHPIDLVSLRRLSTTAKTAHSLTHFHGGFILFITCTASSRTPGDMRAARAGETIFHCIFSPCSYVWRNPTDGRSWRRHV